VYPSTKVKPADAFTFAYSTYAKGSSMQLTFNIENFTYTLYCENHAFDPSGSGVVIEKDGKYLSNLRCAESSIENNLYHLKDSGLKKVDWRNIWAP
ncbi:MAG: hypothetical protein ACREJ4_15010, partial [Candidatus Methylomirabilaceae bacterium]